MKKYGKYILLGTALCAALSFATGCSSKKIAISDTPDENAPSYSNLVDDASINQLTTMLKDAGVTDAHIDQLVDDIKDYNDTTKIGLSNGYALLPKTDDGRYTLPEYEIDKAITAWTKKYPIYTGYNCRITAYEIMRDFVSIECPELSDNTNLFMDEIAINDENPSPDFDENEYAQFEGLYPTIQTNNSIDPIDHYQDINDSYTARKVTYTNSDQISQLSVYIHTSYGEDDNELFIGHTGVLLPAEDGSYYFFEKLSFESPYQLVHFQTKDQVIDYLNDIYDTDTTGTAAPPIIYENDHVI